MSASSISGEVRLDIPASSAYLSLARVATSSICARLDFSLEQLEDLTLAVDEALSLLLLDAVPGTGLVCRWTPGEHGVDIAITSTSQSGRIPRANTFSWTVLSALVDSVAASVADGHVTISMGVTKAGAAVR